MDPIKRTRLTGGCAFPSSQEESAGMDMRDFFAAHIVAHVFMARVAVEGVDCYEPLDIAEAAYELADAMIKARRPLEDRYGNDR